MPQAPVSTHLEQLSSQYRKLHVAKEDAFWEAKMGLHPEPGTAQSQATESEKAWSQFLSEPSRLKDLRELREQCPPERKRTLEGWIAMFEAHSIDSAEGRKLRSELIEREAELERARMEMKLGFTDPDSGSFVPASTNRLRLILATDPNEARRRAAFEGLMSIEPFVLDNGFLEIVKLRNRFARVQGYGDYYSWKVWVSERMKKERLFELLGELKQRTQDAGQAAVKRLIETHGDAARAPYNTGFLRAGKLAEELDPYFPFAESFRRWVRGFSALGIRYRGATLKLDLVDRKGKYENGFMHGPEPAFYQDGTWQKARIHFTANAVPGQVGSGLKATQTFFHEGGHAAHFANIQMDAPCFSQEFAPTSVGYAETQSMFLDSLIEDADFRLRYAADRNGSPMPMELIERSVEEQQPFRAFRERSLMIVPFAEKALYEMSDDEMTPDHVRETFREVERDLTGLSGSPRPVLSVPHLLSGEASAYYHGYVLAEMGVSQTRHHFLEQDGYLTDNPNIGPALANHYWKPGNSVSFDDTLSSLTGAPLSADALVTDANRSVDEAIALARTAVERAKKHPLPQQSVVLDANIEILHGTQSIATAKDGTLLDAADKFAQWIDGLE